jgi:hypothetical protein
MYCNLRLNSQLLPAFNPIFILSIAIIATFWSVNEKNGQYFFYKGKEVYLWLKKLLSH